MDFSILKLIGGFIIVAVAANEIAKFFVKRNLPIITGLLITGIVCGPYLFNLVPETSIPHLSFINDIALAFIALVPACSDGSDNNDNGGGTPTPPEPEPVACAGTEVNPERLFLQQLGSDRVIIKWRGNVDGGDLLKQIRQGG